jgi:hypothetical protein
VKIEFYGIYEIFTKMFEPLKIETSLKLEFDSKIYNSSSREIWKWSQKGNLFTLQLSTTMPSMENFGLQKDCVW